MCLFFLFSWNVMGLLAWGRIQKVNDYTNACIFGFSDLHISSKPILIFFVVLLRRVYLR
jgi:hypothetical protein